MPTSLPKCSRRCSRQSTTSKATSAGVRRVMPAARARDRDRPGLRMGSAGGHHRLREESSTRGLRSGPRGCSAAYRSSDSANGGGGSRTHTRLPSTVFETVASTVPPRPRGVQFSAAPPVQRPARQPGSTPPPVRRPGTERAGCADCDAHDRRKSGTDIGHGRWLRLFARERCGTWAGTATRLRARRYGRDLPSSPAPSQRRRRGGRPGG